MVKNILFLADGSFNNPILHSQGIPLLREMSNSGTLCIITTFESDNPTINKNSSRTSVSILFGSEVIHISMHLNYSKYYPNWATYFIQATSEVIKIISHYKIDVIHCRSLFPAVIGLIIKTLFKPSIKLLYDNRGVFIEEEIEKAHWVKESFKVSFFRFIEKKVLIKCNHIIVVSNSFKRYLNNKYGRSISNLEKKITVINNKTVLLGHDVASNINVYKSKDKIIAIYSGSNVVWQNIDEIISLIQIAKKTFPQIYFKIISYSAKSILELLKSKSILDYRIEVVQVTPSNVQSQLIKGNFGILLRKSSIINKVSSPLKFAEYLAAGLPILVSREVGDTEEIINKYNVGVITDANYENSLEQMLKLLQKKDIYKRCIEVAQMEFNIKDSITDYRNVYGKL